jgi:ABC-2 type transport system permease protein
VTGIKRTLADSAVIAKRNVIKMKRVPELLVFVLLSPIMFVLLFAYAFGSSITVPGGSYREFLIAGIFAQTVIFGSKFTRAGLAEDIQKGIISRLRSLPMSRSAVVVGRTPSVTVYNGLSVAIMAGTGLVVGWRIRTSVAEAVVGFVLLLVFAYAFSCVMALVELIVPSREVTNNASFMVILPLTFIANTFVPVENLPSGLRTFDEWNPISSSPRRLESPSATFRRAARNQPLGPFRSLSSIHWDGGYWSSPSSPRSPCVNTTGSSNGKADPPHTAPHLAHDS